MQYPRKALAVILALGSIGHVSAAVSPEEARQLGTTLTALGAEKTANQDGSIPEFTNTPITPPADYKPGSGRYTDPFRDEQPLFSIDAKNIDQHADKLSEGTKLSLRRWPSYRLDIYPTHRTGTYSQWVGDNTIKNATRARLVDGGLGVEGAYGGPPFPIPKNGLEVVWNSFLHPKPVAVDTRALHVWTDATGRSTVTADFTTYHEYKYYDPERESLDGLSYYRYLATGEQARYAGTKSLAWYSINYAKQDVLFWSYTTGQRRVSLVPGFKYDTPGPQGSMVDEFFVYSGPPDLYDWQLVGKQEIYVPYNTYRAVFGEAEKVMTPQHLNPDALRWELHRVWVVDGTLKPGMSHALERRTLYLDEDTWAALLSDSYDSDGQLSRVGQNLIFPMYEGGVSALSSINPLFYSTFKDGYLVFNHLGDPSCYSIPVPRRPDNETTPDTMAGSGIR